MTPTNHPITSCEYKLLLNTERFRNRIAGARLFWRVLAFKVKKHDIKFEEDVIPPFVSKFAYSASFRMEESPRIATMQDVLDLFPSLVQSGISSATPISVVNGFRAHEVMHYRSVKKITPLV